MENIETLTKLFMTHLPHRFKWTLHNLVGHPLSEVLYQLGFEGASDWAHEVTAPPESAD